MISKERDDGITAPWRCAFRSNQLAHPLEAPYLLVTAVYGLWLTIPLQTTYKITYSLQRPSIRTKTSLNWKFQSNLLRYNEHHYSECFLPLRIHTVCTMAICGVNSSRACSFNPRQSSRWMMMMPIVAGTHATDYTQYSWKYGHQWYMFSSENRRYNSRRWHFSITIFCLRG